MRKKSKFTFTKSVFYVLCAMLILNACGPSNGKNNKDAGFEDAIRPVPFMWIPKEKGVERELWFRFGVLDAAKAKKSKANLLDDYLSPEKHALGYSYPVASIDALLAQMEKANSNMVGLRIYFGENDQSDEPDGVPMNPSTIPNSQIVLIFSPTDGSRKDLGNYYIFGSDGKPYPFLQTSNPQRFSDWIDNYRTDEAESKTVLANTLNAADPVNIDKVTGNITDTKSILYCYQDFKDFIQKERLYQDSIMTANSAALIDSIAIDFASYPDTGIGPNHFYPPLPNLSFQNRLHVLFGFNIKGNPFYIDDSQGFYERLHIPGGQAAMSCPNLYLNYPGKSSDGKVIVAGGGGSGDNGQLCPPYCN